IKRFGFGAPIIARKEDGEIIAGHTRLEAAKHLRLKEVPVRYLDLDPVDAHLLALADNKLGEVAEWDDLKLKDIFEKESFAVDDLFIAGFDAGALNDIIDRESPDLNLQGDYSTGAEELTGADFMPVNVEPITKTGEAVDIGKHRVICGDCVEVMRTFEDNSIDAIVCDPPYGIDFMNRKWDNDVPRDDWSAECFRILKPGGHLIAFSATRTFHRLGTVVENAGFEVRDTINWLYFSGFPKSTNVSLLIDKASGHENRGRAIPTASTHQASDVDKVNKLTSNPVGPYEPKTEDAKRFHGYGTALKPSFEPAILARKPLSEKNIAANVLKWGTGGLNIDDCRFGYGDPCWVGPQEKHKGYPNGIGGNQCFENLKDKPKQNKYFKNPWKMPDQGRWPANIYQCSKVSRSEREEGCKELPSKTGAETVQRKEGSAGMNNPRAGAGRTASEVKNIHPTVKPIKLMRWLARLVMPPGEDAVLLDTFAGSGSTLVAAEKEGFNSIGIEMNPEYVDIIRARLSHACKGE
ncbi:MAG: DNA methyltransferase, partial [Pseudomonadota bacterium]|nr:DNA methyltransferase [Pseudomonadota bacterium]